MTGSLPNRSCHFQRANHVVAVPAPNFFLEDPSRAVSGQNGGEDIVNSRVVRSVIWISTLLLNYYHCLYRLPHSFTIMGLFSALTEPLTRLAAALPLWQVILLGGTAFITIAILLNIVRQLFFYDRNAPPVAFHIVPILGNAVTYGMDPFNFFFSNHEKYGDVFSFILLGRTVTVCLGTKGNEFILNGKLKDVNAEQVYTALTTPVFGTGESYLNQ